MDNYDDVIKIAEGIEIENISGPKITFKTNDVARQLNESDQTIRNYCKEFAAEIGEIETTGGGHRIFSYENINMLREIIKMCKVDKMSYAQIHEELAQRNKKPVTINESEKYFSDTIKRLFQDLIEINESTKAANEGIGTIKEELINQTEIIKKQEDIIQNQTELINKMQETLIIQEQKLNEVINNQENIARDIAENKKGKKIFGLFSKK